MKASSSRRTRFVEVDLFRDLGFDGAEGANLRIRSELMIAVRRLIEDRGLTQEQAAELFGVTQPRVSDVVRGHIDKFTIDALVKMAAKAGLEVEVTVLGPAAIRRGRQIRSQEPRPGTTG
jgi:predicted XRE-type DNA-binding protein